MVTDVWEGEGMSGSVEEERECRGGEWRSGKERGLIIINYI